MAAKRLRKVAPMPAVVPQGGVAAPAGMAPKAGQSGKDLRAELYQIMGLSRLRNMRLSTTGIRQP